VSDPSNHQSTVIPVIADPPALQDVWAGATCYGCGPSNPIGLHIKSYWADESVVCTFHPTPDLNAGFPNVMYGGMVACLCDCHSIWTAIAATYRDEGREHGSAPIIAYVTGNLNVSYLAPTPLDQPITLRARVEELHARKAIVTCDVTAAGKLTAQARVIAVRYAGDKSAGHHK
jgi:acyl-coenzyme A thioesterase PaaI-like protein